MASLIYTYGGKHIRLCCHLNIDYLLYFLNLPPQILDRTLLVALVADKLRSQWFT